MKHKLTTVSTGGWMVSTVSSSQSDGVELLVTRWFSEDGRKALRPKQPTFANTEQAMEYAKDRGFLEDLYYRPCKSIDLRLSPRTRAYLKTKSIEEIWEVLPRIVGVSPHQRYFQAVKSAPLMSEIRSRWMKSLGK